METITSTERKVGLFGGLGISFGGYHLLVENGALMKPGEDSVGWTIVIVAAITLVTATLMFIIESQMVKLMAKVNVRGTIYEITQIDADAHNRGFGAFGRWTAVNVEIRDVTTGRTMGLDMYPGVTRGLKVGDKVGMVKRPREHTYEMDKYYLLHESKFDVKEERRKYAKNIQMEGTPNTGWLSHVTIEGVNSDVGKDN